MPDLPVDPITAGKQQLRIEMKAKRLHLARSLPQAGQDLATRFGERLARLAAPCFAAYWPLPSELDPRPLIKALLATGAELALPRLLSDSTLAFHATDRLPAANELCIGRFGISEPPADWPIVIPALILVPLLAFDSTGARLGFGQGHYDRTLRDLRLRHPAIMAIGIAFDEQEIDALPVSAFDEALDGIVTPSRYIETAPALDSL